MSKKTLKVVPSAAGSNFAPTEKSGANIETLGTRVRHELDTITRLDAELVRAEQQLANHRREIALRALLLGAILCQVKIDLGHGGFGKFKAEHFGSAKNRQANYYMGLAEVFLKISGVLIPEVLALPQATLDLASPTTTKDAIVKKAADFVGKNSLSDLLELHGLKVRGGYHPSEEAVQKWLTDTHPKQVGKTYADLPEDLQLAFQQSGYNDRDWRTPSQIEQETREAAHAALLSPVTTLGQELDRPEWKQYVSPAELTGLRRELMDLVAKVDREIAAAGGDQ